MQDDSRGVRGALLRSGAALAIAVVGVVARIFPPYCLAALLALPLLIRSARRAFATFEHPRQFVAAVRDIVACYLVAVGLFTGGVMLWAWR